MPSPKEVLVQWIAAFNNADISALADLYADYATYHQAAAEPVVSKPAIIKMFETGFAKADIVCIPDNIFEDSEWAIAEWYDQQGLRSCGFFHVIDSKIVFQRGY